MAKRIVIGTPGGGPVYLKDEVYKPENWFLIRDSAFAQIEGSEERVLVRGYGSQPPIGTVITLGDLYAPLPLTIDAFGIFTQSAGPYLTGIWAYRDSAEDSHSINIMMSFDSDDIQMVSDVFDAKANALSMLGGYDDIWDDMDFGDDNGWDDSEF